MLAGSNSWPHFQKPIRLIQPGGKLILDTSQGIQNLFSAWLKILPAGPKFNQDEIMKMSFFTFN
jgi:hypothetical protein